MFISPSLGSTVVTEEHQCGMIGFGSAPQKVKKCIIVDQKIGWIAMLRADDIRPLNRITAEKDGPVQAHQIVVAFTSVEFDGEPTGIAGEVGKLATECDSTEA